MQHLTSMDAVAEINELITRRRQAALSASTAFSEAAPLSAAKAQALALVRLAIERCDKVTTDLQAFAASGTAIAEKLQKQEPSDQIDPLDTLYATLTAMEQSLLDDARDQWQMSKNPHVARTKPLRAAVERCAMASEAAALATRRLKGAMQAHDAGDPRGFGSGEVHSTPAAVTQTLRKLTET